MALMIPCGNCGRRPHTEFWCSGELASSHAGEQGIESDYARTWLKRNVAGDQREAWFHHAGCRRWTMVVRDTRTNRIHERD